MSFGAALPEITEVHLWSYDPAVTAAGLLDWIEVNGVETEAGSANADRGDALRLVPGDLTKDIGMRVEGSVADAVPDEREIRLTRIPHGR